MTVFVGCKGSWGFLSFRDGCYHTRDDVGGCPCQCGHGVVDNRPSRRHTRAEIARGKYYVKYHKDRRKSR